MNKKILLPILILFLSGCATVNKPMPITQAQHEVIHKFMDEEGYAGVYPEYPPYWTEEYDLDKDGKNEAIVRFITGAHSSGIKVMKFDGEKYKVIFEYGSGTPNTAFKVINGVPAIRSLESDYEPDYATGNRYEVIYQWDGETFVLKNNADIKETFKTSLGSIERGYTKEKVGGIMGKPIEVLTQSNEDFWWYDGKGNSKISVAFIDGKVVDVSEHDRISEERIREIMSE